MMHAAYGDQAVTQSNILRWCGRIREGRYYVRDDPRCGRFSESRTEGNIEKVRQRLLQNRHLSVRMMADERDLNSEIVVEGRKSLLALLYARTECRTGGGGGGGQSCCMSAFD
jgi:hypothetical protein